MNGDGLTAALFRRVDPAPAGVRAAGPSLKPPKYAQIIAGYVRGLIVSGELKLGDHLKSEAELAKGIGAARQVVREALRILEAEGLIRQSQGAQSGPQVVAPAIDQVVRSAGLFLQGRQVDLSDIYSARIGLEPFAARLVAERGDPASALRLTQACDGLEALASLPDSRAFRRDLTRLYAILAEESGNQTLALLTAVLQGAFERHIARALPAQDGAPGEPDLTLALRAEGLEAVRRLIALVEAGDGEGAERHWRDHVLAANRYWMKVLGA